MADSLQATPGLRIHAVVSHSRANGPGRRFVVWVQGCSLGCPGCFNPGTHDPRAGESIEIAQLAARIHATGGIEGVTLTGGEPLEQAPAVASLLESLDARLSVVLFSGYSLAEIENVGDGRRCLSRTDVLIAGRYVAAQQLGHGLRGSANQRVHLLTRRYAARDLDAAPAAEVRIAPDGSVMLSGISPVEFHRGQEGLEGLGRALGG